MSKFKVSFPYRIRVAMADGEAIVRKVIFPRWGVDYLLAPALLSIAESKPVDLDGFYSEGITTTLRYEGGIVVRLELGGWDSIHFGFQWRTTSALVRFYPWPGETWEKKDEVLLSGEVVYWLTHPESAPVA